MVLSSCPDCVKQVVSIKSKILDAPFGHVAKKEMSPEPSNGLNSLRYVSGHLKMVRMRSLCSVLKFRKSSGIEQGFDQYWNNVHQF